MARRGLKKQPFSSDFDNYFVKGRINRFSESEVIVDSGQAGKTNGKVACCSEESNFSELIDDTKCRINGNYQIGSVNNSSDRRRNNVAECSEVNVAFGDSSFGLNSNPDESTSTTCTNLPCTGMSGRSSEFSGLLSSPSSDSDRSYCTSDTSSTTSTPTSFSSRCASSKSPGVTPQMESSTTWEDVMQMFDPESLLNSIYDDETDSMSTSCLDTPSSSSPLHIFEEGDSPLSSLHIYEEGDDCRNQQSRVGSRNGMLETTSKPLHRNLDLDLHHPTSCASGGGSEPKYRDSGFFEDRKVGVPHHVNRNRIASAPPESSSSTVDTSEVTLRRGRRRGMEKCLSEEEAVQGDGGDMFGGLWTEVEALFEQLRNGHRVSRVVEDGEGDARRLSCRVDSGEEISRSSSSRSLLTDSGDSSECELTCHVRCRGRIGVDCSPNADRRTRETSLASSSDLDQELRSSIAEIEIKEETTEEEEDEDLFISEISTLERQIGAYNSLQPSDPVVLCEGGRYQGVVRVHLCVVRPVCVQVSQRPPSIFDLLGGEASLPGHLCCETDSFYLPRDTAKALYISSETTTQEVISALLKKFHIQDDPRKFVMYEQNTQEADPGDDAECTCGTGVEGVTDTRGGQGGWLRRLSQEERPLELQMRWGCSGLIHHRRFLLQENDHMEVMWELFSVPELQNFLEILGREEREHEAELRLAYAAHRRALREGMRQLADADRDKKADTI